MWAEFLEELEYCIQDQSTEESIQSINHLNLAVGKDISADCDHQKSTGLVSMLLNRCDPQKKATKTNNNGV